MIRWVKLAIAAAAVVYLFADRTRQTSTVVEQITRSPQ
jgi:hypothetical protein